MGVEASVILAFVGSQTVNKVKMCRNKFVPGHIFKIRATDTQIPLELLYRVWMAEMGSARVIFQFELR